MKRDSLSHVLKKRRSRACLPSPPLPEKGARGAGHSLRESNPRHSPLATHLRFCGSTSTTNSTPLSLGSFSRRSRHRVCIGSMVGAASK